MLFVKSLMVGVCVSVVVAQKATDEFTKEFGNCKDKCTARKCESWSTDTHPCSAADAKDVVSINPWMCGDARCEETSCDRCGDEDKCVSLCKDKKTQLSDRGFNVKGWPACATVCAMASDSDWMCFQDCNPPSFDGADKPSCFDYWPCDEQACTAKGRQTCSAKNNFVDPWKVSLGDPCKLIPCRRCGGQENCLAFCTEYNDRKSTERKVDCQAECASVNGYKCTFSAPTKEEIYGELPASELPLLIADVDLLAGQTQTRVLAMAGAATATSSQSILHAYRFPIALTALASAILCVYVYLRKHTSSEKNMYTPLLE